VEQAANLRRGRQSTGVWSIYEVTLVGRCCRHTPRANFLFCTPLPPPYYSAVPSDSDATALVEGATSSTTCPLPFRALVRGQSASITTRLTCWPINRTDGLWLAHWTRGTRGGGLGRNASEDQASACIASALDCRESYSTLMDRISPTSTSTSLCSDAVLYQCHAPCSDGEECGNQPVLEWMKESLLFLAQSP
jgi:hypothetical protein